MRTLIVSEFMTLDGVTEAPGGGDHPHGGWTFQDVAFDEAAYEIKAREQQEAGAVLVGRRSWEEFHEIWPTMTEDFARYNEMPKYVVSSTLPESRGGRVAVAADDAAALGRRRRRPQGG